eukprot:CAMPEP_0197037508 /NCGR_PEP_ID=MMETSP1384-20130603/14701_1 /TAXON_ID=29189 /ORGANISM="Ammonia sp." /LENGTH=364 /DNA_ID=CAMNT_0042467821 /DNA_START=128 /DNA_END=1222 /DNA_ORIENTATION=+
MNPLLALLSISLLSAVRHSIHLSEETVSLIESDSVDGCTANQAQCPIEDETNFSVSDVVFTEVQKEMVDGETACCYYYETVKTSRKDCNDKTPALSHWTLGYVCDDPEIVASSAVVRSSGQGSLGDDSSTCYHGIKFDTECSGTCSYSVCLKWPNWDPNGKCCTGTGWAIVKAGTAFSFTETTVPQCTCPTESPTTDPTQNPTPSPTPYCRPIIETWINEGCTADNLELMDTEVAYTRIREYQTLTDVDVNEEFFSSPPSESLAQTILDHACEEDTFAAVGVDQPFIGHDHKTKNDGNEWNANVNESWLERKAFGGYAIAFYVIVALIAYCATLTVVMCRKSRERNGTHMKLSQDLYDGTDIDM